MKRAIVILYGGNALTADHLSKIADTLHKATGANNLTIKDMDDSEMCAALAHISGYQVANIIATEDLFDKHTITPVERAAIVIDSICNGKSNVEIAIELASKFTWARQNQNKDEAKAILEAISILSRDPVPMPIRNKYNVNQSVINIIQKLQNKI